MTYDDLQALISGSGGQLDPTGPNGFEGLVGRLLEALTGQKFFLALSGSQGGQDLATDGRTGNALAVECKRYGESTSLSPDALVAKFQQAAMGHSPPDVWVVVTTKRLGEQHHKRLAAFGKELGIDYVSIDAEGEEKSNLVTLLAADPELTASFLEENGQAISSDQSESIRLWLQSRAQASNFTSNWDRLRDHLLASCLGFAHWRAYATRDLEHLLHEPNASEARWGQNLAVLNDQAKFVPRSQLLRNLNEWLAGWASTHRSCVVLGEEGEGKSWAVMHWLSQIALEEEAPPVVFLPAGDVQSADPSHLVESAIARLFRSDSGAAERRIARWLERPVGDKPLFLLVVDGLNEYPAGPPWSRLLSALEMQPWTSQVAVLMTCRTLFWQEQLQPRFPDSQICTVGPFDDFELNQALVLHGVTRVDIDDNLLPLVRTPRYLNLAVRLRDQLVGAGEVTKERLIYEDQFDRWQRRSSGNSSQLTHKQFQEFLYGLATNLRSTPELPRTQIVSELDAFGNGRDLLNELSSGRILERQGASGWTVNRRYLILAFGLLLAESVRQAPSSDEVGINEVINDFLEPQADMDIKVEICGFALLHAFVHTDNGFTLPIRLGLFRAWLRGRNIKPEDWRRIPAYLPSSPDTYVAMAEWLWSRAQNNAQAQDAFMSGFLQYAENARVHPALVVAFERWFGFVHPDGYRAVNWEEDPERLRKGREAVRSALGAGATEGEVETAGFRLVVTQDQGLLRLPQVALAVISHLDRRPFLCGMVTGMVANTVMGYPESFELYCWTIRSAPDDIESDTLCFAEELIEQGSSTAQKTADFLLQALKTRQAAEYRKGVADEFRYRNPLHDLLDDLDLCLQGLFLWDQEIATECLGRNDVPLGAKLRLGKTIFLNPYSSYPRNFIRSAENAEFALDLDKIDCSRNGQTSEDIDIEKFELGICAVAPHRWVEFERTLSRQIGGREHEGLLLLAFRIFDRLSILTNTERDLIENRWRQLLNKDSLSRDENFGESVLFQCVLWGNNPQNQVARYVERAGHGAWFPRYAAPFPVIPSSVGDEISDVLRSTQDVSLINNLLAFLAVGLETMTDELRNALIRLYRVNPERHARFCREIFYRQQDHAGIGVLIEEDQRLEDQATVRSDPFANLMLCDYGTDIDFDELVRRVAPGYLGMAVERRGNIPDEVRKFAEFLEGLLTSEVRGLLAWTEQDKSIVIQADNLGVCDHDDDWRVSDSDDHKMVFFSVGSVWGGNPGRDNDPEAPSFTISADELNRRSQDRRQRIQGLINQARAEGNNLLASRFRVEGLAAVRSQYPDFVVDWVTKATADTSGSDSFIFSSGCFLEALCECLLDQDPELGARLYRRLVDFQGRIRTMDRITGLDNLFIALFQAPDSTAVNELRLEAFERCKNDKDLFELAWAAQFGNAHSWLESRMEFLLNSSVRYDRARGILVLGLFDGPDAASRLERISAENDQDWLGSVTQTALRLHSRNQWAKSWFTRFLAEDDVELSWAAFRLFFKCVDRRFWLWGPELFEASQPLEAARLHYLSSRLTIAEAAKKNEKNELKLQEQFLGEKVLEGKVWPWMDRLMRFG